MSYENDRRMQKDLLVPNSILILNKDISPIYRLVQDVAGFIIIEKTTLNKVSAFRSLEEVIFYNNGFYYLMHID